MSDVRLYIADKIYEGWKTVEITRAIDQAASSFTVGLSASVNQGVSVLPIAPGSVCRVDLNQQTVITGYIDGITGSYDDNSHSYSVTGRSAIGDLVDCSTVVKGGEFLNQTVVEIASAVCRPFNISVIVEDGADIGAPLTKHRVDNGGVHEVIERACRRRGLLLSSSSKGELVIGQIGSKKITIPLVFGKNIKSASGRFVMNNRFSEYRVKAQSTGGDAISLDQQIHAMHVTEDPNIKRYRPLVIDAEEGELDLSKRGQFEASVRMGRSTQITYSVQGWEHGDGLWAPNCLVRVIDPYFNINGWFLISSVAYSYSDSGTQCNITVMPKEAFTVQKLTEKSTSSGQDWGDIFGEEVSTASSP